MGIEADPCFPDNITQEVNSVLQSIQWTGMPCSIGQRSTQPVNNPTDTQGRTTRATTTNSGTHNQTRDSGIKKQCGNCRHWEWIENIVKNLDIGYCMRISIYGRHFETYHTHTMSSDGCCLWEEKDIPTKTHKG